MEAAQQDMRTSGQVGCDAPRGEVELVALGASAANAEMVFAAVLRGGDHTREVGGGGPDEDAKLASFLEILVGGLKAGDLGSLPIADGGMI